MSAPPGPTPHESAAASTGLSVKEAALVVGIVLIWASLYPVGKLTFAEITPSQLTFVRAALASVVLLAVCSVTGRLPLVLDALRPPHLAGVLVLGLSGFALSAWLSMAALGHLPSGVSSLLSNSSPLMVAAVAVLLLRERADWRTVSGVIIGFAGVVLIALFLALPIAGEPLTLPVLLGGGMIVGGVTLANVSRR